MTMLQLSALSRGFDCLNWLIDEECVTILLIFLRSYVWFVLICPALQKLFGFAWAQRNGGFLFMPTLTVPWVCILNME